MGGIAKDPAIERWAMMRDNTHLYFRLRPLTVITGLVAFAVIPYGLYRAIKAGEEWSNQITGKMTPYEKQKHKRE